jgi:hypothetical protein
MLGRNLLWIGRRSRWRRRCDRLHGDRRTIGDHRLLDVWSTGSVDVHPRVLMNLGTARQAEAWQLKFQAGKSKCCALDFN